MSKQVMFKTQQVSGCMPVHHVALTQVPSTAVCPHTYSHLVAVIPCLSVAPTRCCAIWVQTQTWVLVTVNDTRDQLVLPTKCTSYTRVAQGCGQHGTDAIRDAKLVARQRVA